MLGDVIVSGASGILERLERAQVLSVSQDVLEELLLLECKVNIEIIDLLKSQDPVAALSAAVARAIRPFWRRAVRRTSATSTRGGWPSRRSRASAGMPRLSRAF